MKSEIYVGRVSQGFAVRVVGRGTMHESSAFRQLVEANLPRTTVVFDATQCEYLDSTFLGCLIGLQKTSEHSPHEFLIAASPESRMKLFSLSSLNKYFDFIEPRLVPLDDFVQVDVDKLDAVALGRHIMRCHSVLAERGGSEAPAFRAIADRLAEELGEDEREENNN
jgi:anti-anti-sigma regulatory factor